MINEIRQDLEDSQALQALAESSSNTSQQTDANEVPEVFLRDGKFNTEAVHWLPSYTEDQLYLQMCESKEIPIRKQNIQTREIYYEKENRYYFEAATYAGRISAGDFAGKNAKHKPIFHLDLSGFSARLIAELAILPKETIDRIVTGAVFKIFRARHQMIFYQNIQNERLRWVIV